MQIRGFRIEIILLVFLLILGILFAGQHFLYRQQVLQPLEESFAEISGVEDVELLQGQDQLQVRIHLAPVDNLRDTHLEIKQAAQELLGNENWTVLIDDGRNQFLENVFYEMHFVVAEGIATGRFAAMARELKAIGQDLDQQKFFVDGENVYIHLVKDDAYLYEIIPRLPVTSGGNGGASFD